MASSSGVRSSSPSTEDRQPLLQHDQLTMESARDNKIHDAEVAVENVDYSSDNNAVKQDLPASLEGLNSDEWNKIRRSATWKMDVQLLPTLIIMSVDSLSDLGHLLTTS